MAPQFEHLNSIHTRRTCSPLVVVRFSFKISANSRNLQNSNQVSQTSTRDIESHRLAGTESCLTFWRVRQKMEKLSSGISNKVNLYSNSWSQIKVKTKSQSTTISTQNRISPNQNRCSWKKLKWCGIPWYQRSLLSQMMTIEIQGSIFGILEILNIQWKLSKTFISQAFCQCRGVSKITISLCRVLRIEELLSLTS
jgi:hypothetical protein